ncbi:MAG: FkbM family methyltransferase, partial [Alphaproteobacteria bacterium]|nr:FkbM family methyltransferase [Alphaproteobacteria bacterium]
MVLYRRRPGDAPMVSFAQNGEDVIVDRLFPQPFGFYIDVGACHPVRDSVTNYFYVRGWRGINIEPVVELFDFFNLLRPADTNLNMAIGEKAEKRVFYAVPTAQVSTLDYERLSFLQSLGTAPQERLVDVETLAQVCERHVRTEIDLLKIDAEGWEAAVIAGADWQRFRPRLVIIESTEPNTAKPAWPAWERTILNKGYVFGMFDGINRYYLRQEDVGLLPQLAAPVNYLDTYTRYELVHHG